MKGDEPDDETEIVTEEPVEIVADWLATAGEQHQANAAAKNIVLIRRKIDWAAFIGAQKLKSTWFITTQ